MNVRVLWFQDRTCVLFNSLDGRLSSRCPAIFGRVAERVEAGSDLEAALDSFLLEGRLREAVARTVAQVAGRSPTPPVELPDVGFIKLVLCPTADCNLRCGYCYASAGVASRQTMTEGTARRAVEWYGEQSPGDAPLAVVFHGGGEPMTNLPAVQAAVSAAREAARTRGRPLFLRTSTNGVYPRWKAEWVASNFDHVSLGLDGPPEIHDRYRRTRAGGGTYERVLESLRIYREAGVLKILNTVITPESVERMEEIVRHFGALGGIERVRLQPMAHCGRCGASRIEPLDPERYLANLAKARRAAERSGIEIVSFLELARAHKPLYCGGCGLNMVVGWAGQVSTCHEALHADDPAAREFLCGRLDGRAGAVEIDWSRVHALRGRTYESLPECRECVFRTNCAGGCAVRAARSNGTALSVDREWCHLVRSALNELFGEMAERLSERTASEE